MPSLSAGDILVGSYTRFPLAFTPENPNGWTKKKQSFGSLNNYDSVPHAAEDWNKGGTCDDSGEPLFAIASGTVRDKTSINDAWGRTILIQHDAPQGKYFLTGTGQLLSTVYSLYGHMLNSSQTGYIAEKDIQQDVDEPIMKGNPVGQVGDGNGYYSNACHLHFAILTDGNLATSYRSQDPYSWSALGNFTDPSELIANGLYSDQSTTFTIVVHPYECNGAFQLSGTTPGCSSPSSTIGNWARQGATYDPGGYELGYSGIIYSKEANVAGTVTWTPNLPRDGQYRVSVYVPNDSAYTSSQYASYCVVPDGTCYDPIIIDQSSTTVRGKWTSLGTYSLYKNNTPKVFLDGNTSESGKMIAADAVKFEYVGPIQ